MIWVVRSASRSPKRRQRLSKARGLQPILRAGSNTSGRKLRETTSDYDRENLHKRLAKLVGGVAVIKVGAVTEAELKEKKRVWKTPSMPRVPPWKKA